MSKEITRTPALTDQPFAADLSLLPEIGGPPYEDYRRAIVEGGLEIVETACNKPQNPIEELEKAGIVVIHKCTSMRHALQAERWGVDAISIDGFECARHRGEEDIPGLAMISAVADKAKISMIASGTFGHGTRAVRGTGVERRRHRHGHALLCHKKGA